MYERPADRNALPHPTRKLPRITLQEIGESDEFKQMNCPIPIASCWPAAKLNLQQHVLKYCPPVKQQVALKDESQILDGARDLVRMN
jgi:hypothetical protein